MPIKRIYHADPLLCPRCGGTMEIIAFIEAPKDDVLRKILEHCGLWHDPPCRAPPQPPRPPQPGAKAGHPPCDSDSPLTYEVAPDFLE